MTSPVTVGPRPREASREERVGLRSTSDAGPSGGAVSGVRTYEVSSEEAELRLDRWFRRHFPALSHGRLEKLLRTGQVRVDGRRAKAGARLAPGQRIRVPPLDGEARGKAPAPAPQPAVSEAEAAAIRAAVLYRDEEILAIDKPAGLAVQGGTKLVRHLDALLDALRFEAAERPRLVHRLDKDTSGVLLLARNAKAAARLGQAFRSKAVRKVYWAVVTGRPRLERGRIDLPLAKGAGARGERVAPAEEGREAVTYYAVLDAAGKRASWLALLPLTGRTHQLRVHCAAMGTPILGDGKYGGKAAFLVGPGISRKLHLHAREIVLPAELSATGKPLRITASLPTHMAATFRALGFAPETAGDPFVELEL